MKNKLIGISEAAALIGMKPSHLQYYIKGNRFIRGEIVAGRILFNYNDVMKWKPKLRERGRPRHDA